MESIIYKIGVFSLLIVFFLGFDHPFYLPKLSLYPLISSLDLFLNHPFFFA